MQPGFEPSSLVLIFAKNEAFRLTPTRFMPFDIAANQYEKPIPQ
jgi:hypothetical protein